MWMTELPISIQRSIQMGLWVFLMSFAVGSRSRSGSRLLVIVSGTLEEQGGVCGVGNG